MKFTLDWLKDHLQTDAPLAAILDAMTRAGLEVEHVEDPAAKLAAFSVARIIAAEKHPNADKLRVCQVETKDGRKEIVCGAPNARAGLVTAFAPIGTYIPGTGMTLEAKPVRGVVSNGMLCSGAELEIDTEADGILELDPALAVGTPLAQALGLSDAVIDFEVTPNRPDWLGVDGVARDLAAVGVGAFLDRAPPRIKGTFESPLGVMTEDELACPLFTARLIRGVRNGPSPAWLQRRLRAVGLKPRSALVDITNYLMIDRCRPLHVYDAAKLTGTVCARLGRPGETFDALDGETYEITPAMCVIADNARVLGLGGVMGGAFSGCSAETTDVLLESALFDPNRTFETIRATGIHSDAGYRFARGVDPMSAQPGLDRATAMILELCGGEASLPMVAGAVPPAPAPILFDPARVRTLAGLDVPLARIKAILKALGFRVAAAEGTALAVTPPTFRADVTAPADLVEEIARVHGYDHLPQREPPRAAGFRAPPASVGESRSRLARRALAAAGYLECVTWAFCARAHAALFGGGAPALLLANPIAAELDCMRPTPLPNLLRAAQRNLDHGRGDAWLFEIGAGYLGPAEHEQIRIAAAVRQPRPNRHWRGAEATDAFELKRDALAALAAAGAPIASLSPAAPDAPWQHPGQAGGLRLGARLVARFGAVHPRVLQGLGVEGPAFALELLLDALPAPRAKATRAKPPLERSELMPVTRDFAFVVAEEAAAADLVRAAFGADKALIADVRLFDVYRGPGVPEGAKSLAIEVELQPQERTLTDAEIEAASARIVAAVAKATGATRRA